MSPEQRLIEFLGKTRQAPLRVKSDYVRRYAEIVAMAASLNLVTTKTGRSSFASSWLITTTGLSWLNEKDD